MNIEIGEYYKGKKRSCGIREDCAILSHVPKGPVQVSLNGILQQETKNYTVSGNAIVFVEPPSQHDIISVHYTTGDIEMIVLVKSVSGKDREVVVEDVYTKETLAIFKEHFEKHFTKIPKLKGELLYREVKHEKT
jgi:hypothetical protein